MGKRPQHSLTRNHGRLSNFHLKEPNTCCPWPEVVAQELAMGTVTFVSMPLGGSFLTHVYLRSFETEQSTLYHMHMHSLPPSLHSEHRRWKLNEQDHGLEHGKWQVEHVHTLKKLERVQSREHRPRWLRGSCDLVWKDLWSMAREWLK